MHFLRKRWLVTVQREPVWAAARPANARSWPVSRTHFAWTHFGAKWWAYRYTPTPYDFVPYRLTVSRLP